MRRMVRTALFAALVAVATGVATAEAQQRIGFVNSSQIVAQAPDAASARQQLETEMLSFRTELDGLETELDSLQSTLERQGASLSASAQQQRQQELQQKFMAYQQRAAELQQTAAQREQEILGPVMQRIGGVIEEVRQAGGYSLILDAAAGSVIVAADPELNVTEQVLARLRAN